MLCLHLYNLTPWQETRVHLELSFPEVALGLLLMNPMRDQTRPGIEVAVLITQHLYCYVSN